MNNKILIAIIVVLAVAAGYLFWSNSNQNASESEVQNGQQSQQPQDQNGQVTQPTEDEAPVGRIAGSLSYPSEGIPANMQVCAEAVDMSELYCTDAQLTGNQYTYGKGYEITVPTGQYRVFATLAENPKDPNVKRAYYNEFVKCGLSVDCKDTTPIVVTVAEGKTVTNINPWDWYNN